MRKEAGEKCYFLFVLQEGTGDPIPQALWGATGRSKKLVGDARSMPEYELGVRLSTLRNYGQSFMHEPPERRTEEACLIQFRGESHGRETECKRFPGAEDLNTYEAGGRPLEGDRNPK